MRNEAYYDYTPHSTRRGFLIGTAKVIAGTAALMTPLAHRELSVIYPHAVPGREAWERLETGTLFTDSEKMRQEMEAQYGIQILNPTPELHLELLDADERDSGKMPATEWKAPQLEGLKNALDSVPPHFYEPRIGSDGTAIPLRFALDGRDDLKLTDKDGGHVEAAGYCNCGKSKNALIVIKRDSDVQLTEYQEQSRNTVVHELTHYITQLELDNYIAGIAAPLSLFQDRDLHDVFKSKVDFKRETSYTADGRLMGDKIKIPYDARVDIVSRNPSLTFINQWYAADEEILATYRSILEKEAFDYETTLIIGRRDLIRAINAQPGITEQPIDPYKAPITIVRTGVNDKNIKEKENDHIGYGATNFHEFFSVASEYYQDGRDEFIKKYSPFLGEEKSNQLYNRMRALIYRGKEYSD